MPQSILAGLSLSVPENKKKTGINSAHNGKPLRITRWIYIPISHYESDILKKSVSKKWKRAAPVRRPPCHSHHEAWLRAKREHPRYHLWPRCWDWGGAGLHIHPLFQHELVQHLQQTCSGWMPILKITLTKRRKVSLTYLINPLKSHLIYNTGQSKWWHNKINLTI